MFRALGLGSCVLPKGYLHFLKLGYNSAHGNWCVCLDTNSVRAWLQRFHVVIICSVTYSFAYQLLLYLTKEKEI